MSGIDLIVRVGTVRREGAGRGPGRVSVLVHAGKGRLRNVSRSRSGGVWSWLVMVAKIGVFVRLYRDWPVHGTVKKRGLKGRLCRGVLRCCSIGTIVIVHHLLVVRVTFVNFDRIDGGAPRVRHGR